MVAFVLLHVIALRIKWSRCMHFSNCVLAFLCHAL